MPAIRFGAHLGLQRSDPATLSAYISECLPALRRAQTARGSAEGRPLTQGGEWGSA